MRIQKLGIPFAFALLATLFAGMANAAPIFRLDATEQPIGLLSNFSLTFEDLDEDSLFSLDELLTFSGITYDDDITIFLDNLIEAPIIKGFADGPLVSPSFFGLAWILLATSDPILPPFDVAASAFTYTLTRVPTTVPEPTTLSLLALSLTGLGWQARRQRAGRPAATEPETTERL